MAGSTGGAGGGQVDFLPMVALGREGSGGVHGYMGTVPAPSSTG